MSFVNTIIGCYQTWSAAAKGVANQMNDNRGHANGQMLQKEDSSLPDGSQAQHLPIFLTDPYFIRYIELAKDGDTLPREDTRIDLMRGGNNGEGIGQSGMGSRKDGRGTVGIPQQYMSAR